MQSKYTRTQHTHMHDFTCAFINTKSRPPVQCGGGSRLLTLINKSLGVFFLYIYILNFRYLKIKSFILLVCSSTDLDY